MSRFPHFHISKFHYGLPRPLKSIDLIGLAQSAIIADVPGEGHQETPVIV